MTDSPLVSVQELAARLEDPALLVLDATVIMPAPRFDGDYRAESGARRFALAHVPGAVFADLLQDLSDSTAGFHFAMPRPDELARRLQRLGVGDGRRRSASGRGAGCSMSSGQSRDRWLTAPILEILGVERSRTPQGRQAAIFTVLT